MSNILEGSAAWQISAPDFPASGSLREQLEFLVRCAILAPSSYNSQPWKFAIGTDHIDLLADFDRWLKVSDPDQRELHISLGCALENLLVAAERFRFRHNAMLLPDNDRPQLIARVQLTPQVGQPAPFRPLVLFDMIPVRHTNHGRYDGREIPGEIIQQLLSCCVEPGTQLLLIQDVDVKRQADDLVMRGDQTQFARFDYREELAHWIGQGVYGTSWLMAKLTQFAMIHVNLGGSIARKDSDVLMSSPVWGVVATQSDDHVAHVHVGQVYQRLCLLGASIGLWCQPMSTVVQVPELKRELAASLGEPTLTPQHPFRLGYALPERYHTPRRPIDEVLLE